jgi:hypothetical protein
MGNARVHQRLPTAGPSLAASRTHHPLPCPEPIVSRPRQCRAVGMHTCSTISRLRCRHSPCRLGIVPWPLQAPCRTAAAVSPSWHDTGATPAPHRASVARHVSWTSILWPLPSTRRTAAAVSRNGHARVQHHLSMRCRYTPRRVRICRTLAQYHTSHGCVGIGQWACTHTPPTPYRAAVARHVACTSATPWPSVTRRWDALLSRKWCSHMHHCLHIALPLYATSRAHLPHPGPQPHVARLAVSRHGQRTRKATSARRAAVARQIA